MITFCFFCYSDKYGNNAASEKKVSMFQQTVWQYIYVGMAGYK